MNANELMIGDYVIRKNVPKEIFIVDAIDSIKSIVYLDLDGLGITEKLENIEPIPLTREILEKNGFEKCEILEIEYIGWRLNEEFSVELNAVDDFDWNDVHIAYVHQLQHALRLCRIDKEIIL